MVQLSHPNKTTGKTIALTKQTLDSKVVSLVFNTLSRFVTAFLTRSKCFLISCQSLWAVILKLKKIKPVIFSIFSPSIYHEVMAQDAIILVFWMLSFNPAFSLSSFTFIKRLFSSSSLSAICISEVINISPSNLDSSLRFIQPSILHDVLYI